MHADEKMKMVIKLIIGEIKEGGKNSSLYLEFLLCMLLRLLALSLIAGENRGWGSVRRRRVRDSGSLFWLLHHHASGNSMHAD